jgi:cobalt-zinc-cadmium efflux system outer membrane protein
MTLSRSFHTSLFVAVALLLGIPSAVDAAGDDTSLTLARALAMSLERSPDLAAFSWEIRAAEGRVLQAGLRPNPEVSIEAEDVTGSGAFKNGEEAQRTVQLSQLLELGGKRRARVEEAEAGRDIAEWEYQVRRVAVLKETTLAFIDVLAAQRHLELAEEAFALAKNAIPLTQKRVEVGQAPLVEATRANVAAASARLAVHQAQRQLQIARGHLAAQWGAKTATFGLAAGGLDHLHPVPSIETLRVRLFGNPQLTRWNAEREKRAAALRTAQAKGVPDLSVAAGPRLIGRGAEVTVGTVGVSIPLPLFDRNQGEIAAARADLARTDPEQRAVEARAFAALNEAHETLLRTADEVKILNETVLPGATTAVEQLVAGYETGRVTQLEIIEARRTLTDARSQHLRALADYHKALAEIDALTARPAPFPQRTGARSKKPQLLSKRPALRK